MIDNRLEEWKNLLSETLSKLEFFNRFQDSNEFRNLVCSISELDTCHRDLLIKHRETVEEKGAAESLSRLFGDFFSQAPIGYIVLNAQGLIEDANCVASEYWGISRHRMKGLGLFGLISGENTSLLSKAIDAAKNSSQRKSIDIKCVRPGGQNFWGRFDIIMAEDTVSGKKRLLCSVVDITSDRILEDAIKKTAVGLSSVTGLDFFRQLSEFLTGYANIDFAVISEASDDGNFVPISVSPLRAKPSKFSYSNREELQRLKGNPEIFEPNSHHVRDLKEFFAAQDGISMYLFDANRQISGHLAILTEKEFDNKKLYSSILKVLSARAAAELQRYRAEEKLKAYRDSLESQIDKRTAELKRNNQKLAHEVEKRKITEKNLREAKGQAEQATKAKSAFLANMSHEIRTPMSGILGVASIMERLELSNKLRGYVKMIRESGDNLLHIINDILDISKLESGRIDLETKKFNLRDLLRNVCEVHYEKAKVKGIYLFLEYPYDLPEIISSDPVRIRQIVENLVSNAIKFTEKGLVIVRVGFPENNKFLEIKVEDSGIGLSAAEINVIFDRFAQADSSTTRRYGGTGLGLSICKKIASLFGGEITCESKRGAYSVFSFHMPLFGQNQASVSGPKMPGDCDFAVCVDNDKLKNALVSALRSVGAKVYTEKSLPFSAKKHRSLYVITDGLELPDFNGVEPKILGFGNEEDFHRHDVIFVESPFAIDGFLAAAGGTDPEQQYLKVELDDNILDGFDILLAEDNEISCSVAVDLLKSMGADVYVANDGLEAVELFRRQQFHLILMDCLMPNVDGFEALELIRSMGTDQPPIVALTANAMKGDREKCMAAGFDEYVSKPVQTEDLVRIKMMIQEARLP